MFSDFWCKGTIKKATDKMHYTYNENYFSAKKRTFAPEFESETKKGYDHADGRFIYTLLYI